MAKYRIADVQISGSAGGRTWAHNRYGQYFRNRSIPVISTTPFALAAKSRFQQMSSQWKAITDSQRAAWQAYADSHPIVNSLGESVILSGNAAFVGINCRILQNGGTTRQDPPTTTSPSPLTTLTGTFDIGSGSFEIAFTPATLGASLHLWAWAAVLPTVGRNYVKNLLKLVYTGAAATASPIDLQSAIEARFGGLSVNQKVVIQAAVFNGPQGLLSTPLQTSGVVTST